MIDLQPNLPLLPSRAHLRKAKRVVIKCGTAILNSDEGYPSLTRLSNLVESVVDLSRQGVEVVLVASGAVGCGKQVLNRANLMRASVASHLRDTPQLEVTLSQDKDSRSRLDAAAAATGQLALMSLFDTLFSALNVQCSQLLFVSNDFKDPNKVSRMSQSIEALIELGIVPIINENDAVSAIDPSDPESESFSDNDALAALVARLLGSDLLIIMTDVDGVYNMPPKMDNAQRFRTLDNRLTQKIIFGDKSSKGRGGMQSKVQAALKAVHREPSTVPLVPQDNNLLSPVSKQIPVVDEYSDNHMGQAVEAVLIINGLIPRAPIRAMLGEDIGTLVVAQMTEWSNGSNHEETTENSGSSKIRDQIEKTNIARQALSTLSSELRQQVLKAIADALEARCDDILAANAEDLKQAAINDLAPPLLKRLKLTKEKLYTLATGIRDIAEMPEPIGRVVHQLEISTELNLDRVTTPIGTLLVIFESRPDSLPQIAALSLKSGNGLILKGGKEAERSNKCLHAIITETVERETDGIVSRDVISLVTTRAQISQLLALDELIDLVVPRGSNALVKHIQNNTKIPVLGHADGVCHVYIDAEADLDKALRIAIDAKTNYPAACNAMETLLVHESLINSGVADRLLRELRLAGVTIYGGPKAVESGLISAGHLAVSSDTEESADPLHIEYGDLICTCEVVFDLAEAIEHCNRHGSGHTECIVTENSESAERFLAAIDSACVFVNASTRFADGFRLGLGAEVGISTSRIHARGPVGIEGLLTSKWVLRSSRALGHTVSDFADEDGLKYTHRSHS